MNRNDLPLHQSFKVQINFKYTHSLSHTLTYTLTWSLSHPNVVFLLQTTKLNETQGCRPVDVVISGRLIRHAMPLSVHVPCGIMWFAFALSFPGIRCVCAPFPISPLITVIGHFETEEVHSVQLDPPPAPCN